MKSMLLVDILARELKVWPGQYYQIFQDSGGYLHGSLSDGDLEDCDQEDLHGDPVTIAWDGNNAVVDRAEWQAAVEALKAEQESEPAIDWSKQPKGFPLWLEGTTDENRKHSGWHRKSGGVFIGEDAGEWSASREGQFFTVHTRPINPPVAAEQAAELKWPDGAEFMGTTKEGDPKVFYRNVDGDYEYRYEHEVYWSKSKGKPVHTPLTPRPTERAVEWDGVGSPPVGTVCEYQNSLGSWFKVEITAIAKKGICFIQSGRDGESYACKVSSKFRPIRTQEQIAAEERSKAIDDMVGALGMDEPGTSEYIRCGLIYDAGFRKQVEK